MRAFAFIFIQIMLTCSCFSQQKPKLYVFLPSNMRPFTMEGHFSADCNQLQVQVFSRHRELKRAVESASPDGILAPSPVLRLGRYPQFKSRLTGSRAGATSEDYVLVSVGHEVDLEGIGDKAIGAVDLLDRRAMAEFISTRLGNRRPRKVESVTKQDELLTILQFRDVDAIFVSSYLVDSYYRKRSKMDLRVTKLPSKVGLPTLSVKPGEASKITLLMDCLTGMSESLNTKLGIDKWVVPRN